MYRKMHFKWSDTSFFVFPAATKIYQIWHTHLCWIIFQQRNQAIISKSFTNLLFFKNVFYYNMNFQTTNKQIISLWVGKQSQQFAYGFYNLQAQQIFNDEEDPIEHASIWKNVPNLEPRMLLFDTEIERLSIVREVNNKKMIQNIKKQDNWSTMMGVFGQIDARPLEHHAAVDKNKWPMHSNWNDKQSNYFLIDKSHTTLPKQSKQGYSVDIEMQRFQTFQQFYKINAEQAQNRIRKQLESTDYLKLFSLCTDEQYSGFTSKMIEYLRQECPKKCYMLTSLACNSLLPIFSLPKFYQQIDIIVPIDISNYTIPYFSKSSLAVNFAPYINCLLTPFVMKDADPYSYIASITPDNRKLFNTAYTLPIIDQHLNLMQSTNIFLFEEAAFKKANKNKEYQEKGLAEKNVNQNVIDQNEQHQSEQLRLNFTNDSYLSLSNSHKKGKFVSESYILKGHFNDFQKLFKLKAEPSSLSIKYLQGIFSAPSEPQISYTNFYHSQYDEKVEAYPYQIAMFSHEIFGDSLREALLKNLKKGKLFNQEWPQQREKIFAIADYYLEHSEDSD